MQYVDSIFGELIKPIDRRQFREIVERHHGNAYDKSFKSWDHLVTMVGAQLGGVASLRAVEATFKANSHQHYHLGVRNVPRSTLSRANARRPVGVFADTFAMLAEKADRHTRVEGAEMVRLIELEPDPVGQDVRMGRMEWSYPRYEDARGLSSRERCPALRRDYARDRQRRRDRPSNGTRSRRDLCFRQGLLSLWLVEKDQRCQCVLRDPRQSEHALAHDEVPLRAQAIGDGFRIIADADVILASKGNSKLPIPLRRIKVKRDKGGTITLITNDLERTAVEIAALYKSRWQIELLFRWIKQHLNLRKFMGKNDNAIRLQIIAAMIAYLLLRLARRLNSLRMLDLRLAELVCQRLFMRSPIAEIDKPPPVNPSKPKPKFSPDQLGFTYA